MARNVAGEAGESSGERNDANELQVRGSGLLSLTSGAAVNATVALAGHDKAAEGLGTLAAVPQPALSSARDVAGVPDTGRGISAVYPLTRAPPSHRELTRRLRLAEALVGKAESFYAIATRNQLWTKPVNAPAKTEKVGDFELRVDDVSLG